MKLSVTINPASVSVVIPSASLGVSTGKEVVKEFVERDPYTGETTVTPSAETQILHTNGLRMTEDITVNPIPNNYGLITWDGSVITVS